MDIFINSIPEARLEWWLWWLSRLSALVGLLLALMGYMTLLVSDRLGEVKVAAEARKAEQAEQKEQAALKDSEEKSKRLAEAEAKLAETQKAAADAQDLAARVHETQQPRSIPPEKRQKFITDLKVAAGTPDVVIVYPDNDKKAEQFARAISTDFTEAGITHLITWWMGDPLPAGVTVLSRAEASDSSASVISNALKQADVSNQYARGALIPEKNVCVIVGVKP
jgi:hypothetical protein